MSKFDLALNYLSKAEWTLDMANIAAQRIQREFKEVIKSEEVSSRVSNSPWHRDSELIDDWAGVSESAQPVLLVLSWSQIELENDC